MPDAPEEADTDPSLFPSASCPDEELCDGVRSACCNDCSSAWTRALPLSVLPLPVVDEVELLVASLVLLVPDVEYRLLSRELLMLLIDMMISSCAAV